MSSCLSASRFVPRIGLFSGCKAQIFICISANCATIRIQHPHSSRYGIIYTTLQAYLYFKRCCFFLKFVVGVFLRVLWFPPHSSVNGSANTIKLNKRDLNSVKLYRLVVSSFYVAHDKLHVISARSVARDLHMTAPGPLEIMLWRQFAAQ